MRRSASSQGFRITPRDREMVRWIGRLRMVTAAQVSERFGLGRAVGYARLNGLVRLGLLAHARVFHAAPGVYTATRAGLSTVDLELPPARVDVRTYNHDVELSSLVIELEREFGRDRLTTEREMRATDTPLGAAPKQRPRFAVSLTSGRGQLQLTPAGHARLHFPDCAVTGTEEDDPILAIELERTLKGRARLRSILSAYVAAHHVGFVRYYPTSEHVRELVETEVSTLRAKSLIEVWDRAGHARRRKPRRLPPRPASGDHGGDHLERDTHSMAISAHTRKLLWSLSGNACARCKTTLIQGPSAAGDRHSVVGRECHIIPRSRSGPRGGEESRAAVDEFANLILLCASCHAVVDDQTEAFSPAVLQEMKRQHEKRVSSRAQQDPVNRGLRLAGQSEPVRLTLVESGDDLLGMLGPSLSITHEPPKRMGPRQRELVGDFLQSAQDWGDIYNDIGPKGWMDAGADLDAQLHELGEAGLVVYATLRSLRLVGNDGTESPWPDAVLKVVVESDARTEPETAEPARA